MQSQAVVHKFGPASDVVVVERNALRVLGRDQVRVHLKARTINPSDIITISGAYSTRTTLPFIPGFEAFGVVHACGEAVRGIAPGVRVLPIRNAGGWQEFKDTEPTWCLRVPDVLSDIEAATSYVNPMTAWLMLHDRVKVRPGMRIAINAAASSIGSILINLANAAGVEPIAIVRSPESAAKLEGRLETVILDDCERPSHLMEALSSRSDLDAVLDCVGGPQASLLAGALRPKGHFIHYGLLSEESIPASFWALHKEISFGYFHLREWVHKQPMETVQSIYDQVAALIASGVIKTTIRDTIPLVEIQTALRLAVPFRATGKTIIV
ncbi:zinc-dependent alcohol dehydrogenase family protein [Ochrobactrum sp. XJ1]|nr:zinc-dependent alcohol dehydrogenase family protein [Ochrobactrum sp. XJ1]